MSEQTDNQLYNINDKLATVEEAESNSSENYELIQKAINGEKKAFEKLYLHSYQYVFFVVRKYIYDDETTYDVVQETFIKVYKGIKTLRAPDAYYSWITTVAKNTSKNFLRSKRENDALDDNDDYSEFLNKDRFEKEVSIDVAAVLNELEPQDAELLTRVYYDGLRVAQIAKLKGVPAATIYSQLNRAKRNLKSQLAVHGIDKAIYSGSFTAMVTTAIRNTIGTSLLSVVIAQQILNNVVNGTDKKEIAVAKVIKQQQKKHVLKIASCIVAISIIASLITNMVFHYFTDDKNNSNNIATNVTSSETSSILQNDDVNTIVDNNQLDSSNTESSETLDEPPPHTVATYIYRDATAEDCYTKGNIPAHPIEDVIVITGVQTVASDGVYNIPETIDGKKVSGIMQSAFCDSNVSSTVKKIIIPATVKTIWENAFSECYNLTDIYLSGKIIDIFPSAFADVSMRSSQLTIHCSYDCKNFNYYYYRNKVSYYDAEYKEWNGEDIQ